MTKVDNSLGVVYDQVPTKEQLKNNDDLDIPAKYGYGTRHFQYIILFSCVTVSFIARGHLGVTIVAITSVATNNNSYQYIINSTGNSDDLNGTVFSDDNNTLDEAGELDVKNVTHSTTLQKQYKAHTTYNWSKPIQETVQGAFFVGYSIMMFPGGLICQRWGGKITLQISLLINGVISILTPWLMNWGDWKAISACRMIQGLSQAGTIPGSQTMLAKWMPESERARMICYVYTGGTVGTALAYQLSGILAESSWGWPSIFWTVGVLCLLTFSFLTMFGANSPAEHKFISDEEKNYILGSLKDEKVQKRKTPWKAIVTSKPVWGATVTQIACGVGIVFFTTQVPTFIHYICGINVKNSGILSSLPFVASIFTNIGFGVLSDYLTNKKIISVKNTRRIFNSISQVGSAVCLVCTSFANSAAIVVPCLIIAQGCQIAFHVGWMLNHIDMAPNYSGTLMAVGNSLAYIFVIMLPVCVSNIVTDVRSPQQWQIMMCSVAGFCVICNTLFVIFISPHKQPWNDCIQDLSPDDIKLDTKEEMDTFK